VPLEQLWAGWRETYVSAATDKERHGGDGTCVFCRIAESGKPSAANGVVWQGELTFAVLNAYPYASGHLLVLPRRHLADMEDLTEAESTALWQTVRGAITAITDAYAPDGINMGANLGRAAGAGIPRHLHVHVLPRWAGDTNFMTTVGGVRVMPESLAGAWEKLHPAWPSS